MSPSEGVETLRALAAPSMPQARATKAVRTILTLKWVLRKDRVASGVVVVMELECRFEERV